MQMSAANQGDGDEKAPFWDNIRFQDGVEVGVEASGQTQSFRDRSSVSSRRLGVSISARRLQFSRQQAHTG